MATKTDVLELHMNEYKLGSRTNELRSAIINDHQYMTEVMGNISVWSDILKMSIEEDLHNVTKKLIGV